MKIKHKITEERDYLLIALLAILTSTLISIFILGMIFLSQEEIKHPKEIVFLIVFLVTLPLSIGINSDIKKTKIKHEVVK